MHGTSVWQSWNTSHAGRDDIAFWSDVVVRGVIDARMEPVAQRRFDGELASRTVDTNRFVTFRTQTHRISRTAVQARRGDGHVMIGLQCRGHALMEQGDARVRLNPGQIALIDSNSPFDLFFPETVERRLVLVPRQLLAHHLERHGSATPCVIPTGSGSAQLVRDIILRLTEKASDWTEADCAAMMDALVSLLDASLQSEVGTRPAAPHLVGIKAEMQARLANARLAPADIADAAGISVRSLYRLFAREHRTFSQALLEMRLAHARSLIERNMAPSLTHVAMSSGFSDSAHFSRAYRAHFGEAPRQTRARLRAIAFPGEVESLHPQKTRSL